MILQICVLVRGTSVFLCTIRRAKCVIVQKRNKIVKPLAKALIIFTALAAVKGLSPNSTMKNRPSRTKRGAPGGCGICTLKQLLTNSPQSHKLPPASEVKIYTVQAIRHITQPVMLFTRLKFIGMIVLKSRKHNVNYVKSCLG